MPEPTSTTSAAAVAGGLITVAGIATGLPADLILPSFVGALWALRQAPEGGAWSRVLQVLAGTLLACWSATPLSWWLARSCLRPHRCHPRCCATRWLSCWAGGLVDLAAESRGGNRGQAK